MTISERSDVYYDPFDVAINADPYPTFKRLRDEAPIYYNERYDVWALSRHARVGSGGRARPRRRRLADRTGQADAHQPRQAAEGRAVRRVRRMAGEEPVRRPHDTAAHGGVRGRARSAAHAEPARGAQVHA